MDSTWNNKVLSDVLGADEGAALRIKQVVLVLVGVLVLAVAAKIKVPMWPVPITMGTFAVLTIGAAYGARLGLVTILAYMLLGAIGFDVFAGSSAEAAGLTYMMGWHGRISGWLRSGDTGTGHFGATWLGPFGGLDGAGDVDWHCADLCARSCVVGSALWLGQADPCMGSDAVFDW